MNKRVKFSGLWNWIVDKLANAVISRLETTSKNVIGAINELNSNKQTQLVQPLYRHSLTDWNEATTPGWYSGYQVLNSPEGSNTYTTGLVLAHNGDSNYPIQIIFTFNSSNINVRIKGSSGWSSWVQK